MTAAIYYRQLSDARRAVIDANIADTESFEIHVISHNFLVELDALFASLQQRAFAGAL